MVSGYIRRFSVWRLARAAKVGIIARAAEISSSARS
jgi:hypothetical protein